MEPTRTEVERKVAELCQLKGINPAHLTKSSSRMLYLQAYQELGQAGKVLRSAAASKGRTGILSLKVIPAVEQAAVDTCNACPHGKYKELVDGTPLCEACGCSGNLLDSKRKDPFGHCPLTVTGRRCDAMGDTSPDDPADPPTWDNRGKPVVQTRADPNQDWTRKV